VRELELLALLHHFLEAVAISLELELGPPPLADVGEEHGQTDHVALVVADRAVHVFVAAALHALVAVCFDTAEALAAQRALEVALQLPAVVIAPDRGEHVVPDLDVGAPNVFDRAGVVLVEREIPVPAVEREDDDILRTFEDSAQDGLRLRVAAHDHDWSALPHSWVEAIPAGPAFEREAAQAVAPWASAAWARCGLKKLRMRATSSSGCSSGRKWPAPGISSSRMSSA
jgi:hypothetical protein